MIKRFVFFFLVVSALTGCNFFGETVFGSGVEANESRPIFGVELVKLNGTGNVQIVQGDEDSLIIRTDDNLLRYITTTISGSTLVIDIKDNTNLDPSDKITYLLVLKNFRGCQLNGSGSISATGMETPESSIVINGAGNIDCSGSADTLTAEINGTGNLDASGLETLDTTVRLSGAGDITVRAKDTLKICISGVGDVSYYGSPIVDRNISGMGDITCLSAK